MKKTCNQDLLHTLYSMAFLVEARDAYTGGHLWRVSQFSTRLALAGGFSKPQAVTAGLGGFLHDLGKVGVPDSILNNKGKLTETEYAVMRTHPELGAQVLQGHPLAPLAMDAVQNHHERIDGRGYPAGRNGVALSDTAKIVALADAFDAMTSIRVAEGLFHQRIRPPNTHSNRPAFNQSAVTQHSRRDKFRKYPQSRRSPHIGVRQ